MTSHGCSASRDPLVHAKQEGCRVAAAGQAAACRMAHRLRAGYRRQTTSPPGRPGHRPGARLCPRSRATPLRCRSPSSGRLATNSCVIHATKRWPRFAPRPVISKGEVKDGRTAQTDPNIPATGTVRRPMRQAPFVCRCCNQKRGAIDPATAPNRPCHVRESRPALRTLPLNSG